MGGKSPTVKKGSITKGASSSIGEPYIATNPNPAAARNTVTSLIEEAPAPLPEIPTMLSEELTTVPKNYQISWLHDPEILDASVTKWRELEPLTVADIIRNSSLPIDYHLRVSENNLKSGFGQVDRNGKLQGIGRECNEFIYEG